MSDQEDGPSNQDAGAGWLGTIYAAIGNRDPLQIPGVVRALARVVIGIGKLVEAAIDVPTAKLGQKSRAIREETEGRARVTKALAKAAAKHVSADYGPVAQRARERFSQEAIQKQENLEAIAVETAQLLSDVSPSHDTSGPKDAGLTYSQLLQNRQAAVSGCERLSDILLPIGGTRLGPPLAAKSARDTTSGARRSSVSYSPSVPCV